MSKSKNITFFAKFLAVRRYLNEVPVEGKKTKTFLRSFGYYQQYVSQVIRTGNCITLLSNSFEITVDSFWNMNHFEDYVKYVFWTFNYSFLLKLIESIPNQKYSTLTRCSDLLYFNSNAFAEGFRDETDEELTMCYIKNEQLNQIPGFARMYNLDKENRRMLLYAVERRVSELRAPFQLNFATPDPPILPTPPDSISKSNTFFHLLVPIDHSPENTLQFIKDKTEEAGFKADLFSPVTRLPNGKNPYGFNGCMAAMIDFFYQHNYFKKEYHFEDIFKAYLHYSGNSIGKLTTFFSEFRQDNSYKKHFAKLNALKIKKLSR